MYNRRYNRCCCQKNYNEKVIEDICNDVGTTAEYKCECTNSCGCKTTCVCSKNKTFVPCVGLKMGTIFPELVSPYVPCQSIEENAFIKAKNEIGKGCNK